MLRKIRITKRLSIAFVLMGLSTLFVGVMAILSLNETERHFDNIAERRLPASILAGELNRDFLLIRIYTLGMLNAQSPQEREDNRNLMNNQLSSYDETERKLAEFHKTPQGRAVFENVDRARKHYDQLHKQLLQMIDAGSQQEARAFAQQNFSQASVEFNNALTQMFEYQKSTSDTAADAAHHSVKQGKTVTTVVIVIATLFGAVLAWLFSRSLIVPMRNAVTVSQRIASADLTAAIHDDEPDEAGDMVRAMAQMQQQLRQTLDEINKSSSQLAATSEELSVVTEQSTQTMHQQSDELDQAATAVTELTTAIEEVARSAVTTSRDSELADEKTRLGKNQVEHTIKNIRDLETELQHTGNSVGNLATRIRDIASVLDVIRAIADQTNLLALNAAIEAARAGDSGRGFAVVADEVRALAHRTQESTKEIERMMGAIDAETATTVSAMSSSSARAAETLQVAHQAGEALQLIAEAISQINNQNLTIASAAEQQATVARDVDRNLVNIRDLAVQTAAGANETQASSAELARLAEQLNSLISKFRL